jgi:RNA polymerase sigma-70 factor (ECF subfamily)
MAEVDEYEARFERLYREHAGAVLAYALRRSSSPDDAADAVAETFVVAWRRVNEVADADVLPWLYGVARRVLSTQRRSRRRQAALAARAASEPDQLASSPVRGTSPIFRALAELPEDVREVLMLRAWEGLSSREAAAVLGCSPVAYRIRLHRARGRLRRALTELETPSPIVQPAPRPSVKENSSC